MSSLLKFSALMVFVSVNVALADEPVWVGSHANLTAVMGPETKIEVADQPKRGRLNLRASRSQEIEVYNWNREFWVKSGVKASMYGQAIPSLTNLSECDHIADVIFEIRDSTPSADVYADSFSKGQTDSNGMYKQKVRTVCLNASCHFELKKANCDSVNEPFVVSSNPFTYSFSKRLTCK